MSTPRLVVVAGPNGSGKTTLTRWLMEQRVDFAEYVNPDEIAAKLDGSYEWRVRAAQKIADERRDACLREGRSFSFETVMSHESKVALMRRARDAGFHVTLFFVGTEDPSINVSRVSNRVVLGGHDVPRDLIVSRYFRTMSSLWEAAKACNRTRVFDSSRMSGGIALWVEVQTEPSAQHRHAMNLRCLSARSRPNSRHGYAGCCLRRHRPRRFVRNPMALQHRSPSRTSWDNNDKPSPLRLDRPVSSAAFRRD